MNPYEQKQQARKERLEAASERAAESASALSTKARQMADVIPLGQPMLTDHYSYKRDRNYRDRIGRTFDRAHEEHKRAEELARRAESVGNAGISSDDPDAITKLEAELATMRKQIDTMKARNKLIRQFKSKGADAQLQALILAGCPEAAARELVYPKFEYMGQGYPGYSLQNKGANARRVEKRIEDLRALAAAPAVEGGSNDNGWRWYEDKDANRICIESPGKPAEEVRSMLKGYGFRWSPSNGRWQLNTSAQAVWKAQQVLAATAITKP